MLVSGTSSSPVLVEGTIMSIDHVDRTVMIMLPRGPFTFDVPSQCEILLNDERVKLRLLQPGDKVHLTFCRQRGFLTALKLAVTTRRTEFEGIETDGTDISDERRLITTTSGRDPATIGPSRA